MQERDDFMCSQWDDYQRFVNCLVYDTTELKNVGIIAADSSAYFNASILKVHMGQCELEKRYSVVQELFNTRNLFLAYPNQHWSIYTNRHIGIIHRTHYLAKLSSNVYSLEKACLEAGLVGADLYFLVERGIDEKLKLSTNLHINVVVAEHTSPFVAPDISGVYSKMFYKYNNNLVPIAIVTFAQAGAEAFLSDMMINLDNIEYITRGLGKRQALEKYKAYQNVFCDAGFDQSHIIELAYAIVEGIRQVGRFSSRGRGFILKEVLKKYIYITEDNFNMSAWQELLRSTSLPNPDQICVLIKEIYERELPFYKLAKTLARNEGIYSPIFQEKYHVSKRIFQLAQERTSSLYFTQQQQCDIHQMEGVSALAPANIVHVIKRWAESGHWSN